MVRLRYVGRAMVRRHVGKARVGDHAGEAPVAGAVTSNDSATTSVLRMDEPAPQPVFVDASGRRHRTLRQLALAAGLAALVAVLLLWLTQLGTTVRPAPTPPCASISAGQGAAPDAGVVCEDR
ncbi:MAG TPA: hypothetical protein VFM55_16000 [Micromonosporaceae bacterium]|nr:hypothetical protein [Micromonosporaceae bacterium]